MAIKLMEIRLEKRYWMGWVYGNRITDSSSIWGVWTKPCLGVDMGREREGLNAQAYLNGKSSEKDMKLFSNMGIVEPNGQIGQRMECSLRRKIICLTSIVWGGVSKMVDSAVMGWSGEWYRYESGGKTAWDSQCVCHGASVRKTNSMRTRLMVWGGVRER